MSLISDDKATLEKRSNSLKDVKVPLRDQIVKKLYDKVLEDELVTRLQQSWYIADADFAQFLERQQIYLRDIDEWSPADAEDSPVQGSSSNLHIPMPFITLKTYHARYMEALLGIDPPFSTKARREDGTNMVSTVEDLMRYVVKSWANRNKGLEDEIDVWIWNWIATGSGVMKMGYLTEYERIIDVENVQTMGPPKVEIDPQTGQEILVPTFTTKEEEIAKTIKKFSGPISEYVQLEDIRMLGGRGDPDRADIVFHRQYLTASDLWSSVDQGMFDEEAVEAIIRGGRNYQSGSTGTSIKQQRAIDAGKSGVDTEADIDRYQILEAHLKFAADQSGITSDIIVWFHLDVQRPLRTTYLRRVIPTGERPFAIPHFHKRPDQEWGVGLLEILHPLSVELDALHNIRLDTGLLMNNPFFFYRASSSMDATTLQMEPGMGIPLDNPQTDVYFPDMPNKTAFTAQEEQVIQTYVERLTGVSDLSLGVMSGSQGASRTASGVRALLGESNTNLNVHLRRLNRAWKKVLNVLYELVRRRVDPGFIFRITGDDGQDLYRQVWPDTLPEVDFELEANSANSNKQVQIETNSQVMQMVMNPLNIQLGVSDAGSIYEAQKAYMHSLGIKDVHRFIKRPQGHSYTLSPEEEFNRVVRGQNVPVTPQADHAAFIAFAETMIAAQDDVRTLQEDQISQLIQQMRKHQEMEAALQQQQAQVAVNQQMQANAALSQQQAPTGLNPLAGG